MSGAWDKEPFACVRKWSCTLDVIMSPRATRRWDWKNIPCLHWTRDCKSLLIPIRTGSYNSLWFNTATLWPLPDPPYPSTPLLSEATTQLSCSLFLDSYFLSTLDHMSSYPNNLRYFLSVIIIHLRAYYYLGHSDVLVAQHFFGTHLASRWIVHSD